MSHRLSAILLALSILLLPTATPADQRYPYASGQSEADLDWRGLLQGRGHGRFEGGLGPLTAPPVIIAPQAPVPWPGDSLQALPDRCLGRVDTRYGPQDIYGAACLSDYPRIAARLPQACRVRVQSWGRTSDAYDATCLRRAGFRSYR
ncbi:hypothetical protein SAMN05444339_103343 [Loktanella atrilutea]|uniref:Uncharacterized protein n=1 Tax=Loktanella atrilutea TaxID=366533 RepID=A0A1M4Z3D5_LOKAT|nr:hypothetical protein [Loktanella atrilutea]SHF12106.1 hypothetical protein SAMN05444339_103343 [Loktanella atrilutea]